MEVLTLGVACREVPVVVVGVAWRGVWICTGLVIADDWEYDQGRNAPGTRALVI